MFSPVRVLWALTILNGPDLSHQWPHSAQPGFQSPPDLCFSVVDSSPISWIALGSVLSVACLQPCPSAHNWIPWMEPGPGSSICFFGGCQWASISHQVCLPCLDSAGWCLSSRIWAVLGSPLLGSSQLTLTSSIAMGSDTKLRGIYYETLSSNRALLVLIPSEQTLSCRLG